LCANSLQMVIIVIIVICSEPVNAGSQAGSIYRLNNRLIAPFAGLKIHPASEAS
jgi:hypothetical protein